MTTFTRRLFATLMGLLTTIPSNGLAQEEGRTLVFISDTHMGIGMTSRGKWQSSEDFRWGHALDGFLNHLNLTYGARVDLVLLGDVLELWQPFPGMTCTTPTPDTSCTIAQTSRLAEYVAAQHATDLKRIGKFSMQGGNRVFILPGNHDAALNFDQIWSKVAPYFGPESRVELVTSGVWVSPSGMVVAEHGHQIGKDVNRFADWPRVSNGRYPNHLARPWGQLFVQKIFNNVEDEYPLIDNISPESVGARYRIASEGGLASSKDLSRFILFNLFETSRSQLMNVLSLQEGALPEWDADLGREAGHRLVVESLPQGDEFASLIMSGSEVGSSLRASLDAQIRELPDADVRQLCEMAAISGESHCVPDVASNAMESLLRSERQIIKPHLELRLQDYPQMTHFLYGHTHEYQVPWPAEVFGSYVTVANTGAFQRVVDEAGFERRRRDKSASKADSLKRITLEDLAPCYTYVVIEDELKPSSLWRWHQGESDASGSRQSPDSRLCQ